MEIAMCFRHSKKGTSQLVLWGLLCHVWAKLASQRFINLFDLGVRRRKFKNTLFIHRGKFALVCCWTFHYSLELNGADDLVCSWNSWMRSQYPLMDRLLVICTVFMALAVFIWTARQFRFLHRSSRFFTAAHWIRFYAPRPSAYLYSKKSLAQMKLIEESCMFSWRERT